MSTSYPFFLLIPFASRSFCWHLAFLDVPLATNITFVTTYVPSSLILWVDVVIIISYICVRSVDRNGTVPSKGPVPFLKASACDLGRSFIAIIVIIIIGSY